MSEKKRPSFDDWFELWQQLKVKEMQQDFGWRFMTVMDEVGSAAKALRYALYDKSRAGYDGEIKKALADAKAQIEMLAICLGFNTDEIDWLGYQELQYAIQKRLPR